MSGWTTRPSATGHPTHSRLLTPLDLHGNLHPETSMARSIVGATRAALTLMTLVSLGVPARADAQIFKKLKDAAAAKVAEKAAGKAMDKAAEKAGVSESVGREKPNERELLGAPLTADTLDLVIKGLAAMSSAMQEKYRIEQRGIAAHNQAGELRASPAVERWNEKSRVVGSCQETFLSTLEDTRQEEFAKKAQQDPAKYAASAQKFALEIAPLQAKGDMEAVQKAQIKWMQELMGVNFKADTAAAKAKCGTIPPKPVQFAQIDSLDGIAKKANVEARALEATAADKGAAAAGGMPGNRFAQARERILTWFYDGAPAKYRFPETPLLAARKAEIEAVKSAF
jgi:hypothetical protein